MLVPLEPNAQMALFAPSKETPPQIAVGVTLGTLWAQVKHSKMKNAPSGEPDGAFSFKTL